MSEQNSVDESKVFGISIRGWIALLLAGTACYMSIHNLLIIEPMYSAFLLSLGFYFGQKKQ